MNLEKWNARKGDVNERNAIECQSIGKRYPHFVLQDVNLTVGEGTVM